MTSPDNRFLTASRKSFDHLCYGPDVPSRLQSSAIEYAPRSPFSTMRIFSTKEQCLRVCPRISRRYFSVDDCGPGFLVHLRSLTAAMFPKLSVSHTHQSVSWSVPSDSVEALCYSRHRKAAIFRDDEYSGDARSASDTGSSAGA